MKVDVFAPEDNVGDVIGDLNRRRGMIKDQDSTPTGIRIKADVPLAEMFGYIGHLRTITSGRGQFSMEFSHYLPCPASVSEKVIVEEKERRAAKANESYKAQDQALVGLCWRPPAMDVVGFLSGCNPEMRLHWVGSS